MDREHRMSASPDEIKVREVVKAVIRGLKYTVSLLEKVLKGEPV